MDIPEKKFVSSMKNDMLFTVLFNFVIFDFITLLLMDISENKGNIKNNNYVIYCPF